MNELTQVPIQVYLSDNVPVVTSRNVAEYFHKRHDHVLRDIDNIISDMEEIGYQNPKLGADIFHEITYRAGTGKAYREFEMTRDGFTLLAMGFTGKEALGWKLKYIDAFNRMEEYIKGGGSPLPAANGAYKEKTPELDIHTAAAVKAIEDILANYNLAALHRNAAIKEPFAGFYDKHYYYILSALMYEEYKKQIPAHIQNGSLYQLLYENNLIEKATPEHHAKKQCSPFTLRKMVDKRSYYLLPIRKDSLQALFKGLPC